MKQLYLFLGLLLSVNCIYLKQAKADPNCSGSYDATAYYDFKESCFKHDVCYSEAPALGLSKADCDNRFFADMKASCRNRSFLCMTAAKTYYTAVSSSYFNSLFVSAGKKGQRILDGIKATKDSKSAQLLIERARAQTDWTNLNKQCSNITNDAKFKECKDYRDSIVVPNIPMKYAMGACNVLGVNWKHGARTENAKLMAEKLGVPLSECLPK